MVIEQTHQEWKWSVELNAGLTIEGVGLAEGSLWRVPLDEVWKEPEFVSEVEFRPAGVHRDGTSIVLAVEFGFSVRPKSASAREREVLKVTCTLEASYSIRPGFEPSNDQIGAFHRGNVVFNCWPYFREFVQNGTVRMSLPPPSVPFLRMLPPRKETVPGLGDGDAKPAKAKPHRGRKAVTASEKP